MVVSGEVPPPEQIPLPAEEPEVALESATKEREIVAVVILWSDLAVSLHKSGDPGGDRSSMQYLPSGFYPVYAPAEILVNWRGKLSSSLWIELKERHKSVSLRRLAKQYGVSYEGVRRTLKRIKYDNEIVKWLIEND